MRARHIRFAAAAAAAALLEAAPLQAQVNWTDGTDFWDVPGNWSGGMVPGINDDVIINVGGLPTVTYQTITSTIRSLAITNATFSVASGTLDVTNTYTSNSATNISGGGLNLNGASSLATLSLTGGTLGGTGAVSISGLGTWTNGSMSGPGVTNANGGMALGDGVRFLDGGRVLNTAGTTTWSGATSDFTNRLLVSNGTINNNGTWLDQNTFSNDITNNGGTNAFNNLGTYTKSGAATTSISVAFNNTGTVNVNAGTLGLSGGGTSSGTFNVGAGSTLDLGGTHAFSATTSIIGGTATSNVVFSNGTIDFDGTYNVAGTTTLSGGTLNFNPASTVNSVGALSISGGTVNFSSGNLITPTSFSISVGTLAGSDTVTVANSFTWTTGTMSGLGVTNANGGMALGDGVKFLDGGRVLNTAGTTTWSGATGGFSNRLLVSNGTINNNGTWLDQNTFTSDIANNGGTNAFNNLGTYTKSGAATTSISVAFNNTGTVNVNAGTLGLSGGGTSSGTFNVGAGSTLDFSGGTHAFSATTSIIGGTATSNIVFSSGTIDFDGTYNVVGTTTVAGSALNFNAASTVNSVGALSISGGIANFSSGNLITPTSFSISGGTLAGSDTVTLANSFTWTNGTMTGPGVTNASGGMALGDGVKFLDGGRVLNTAGTTTWSGATSDFTNRLLVSNGTINNNGTWLDQNTFTNDIANNGGTNAFNNLGTYTKSGAATTSISVAFNNTGTVNVNAGTLGLSGGGTSSGTFNVGAGSTLDLGGTHAFSATTSIIGGTATSNVVFSNGTIDFDGTYNVAGTTTLSGGTLNFNPASTVNSVGALSISGGTVNFSSGNLITPTSFSISVGTLAGSDTVTVANSFTWTTGTMSGLGVTNANGGMALGDGVKFLDGGRVLNTAGTTTWSGATSDFSNRLLVGGGTINNNGTWLDQNTFTSDIANNGGTNAFNNLGTYTKSGAATTFVGVAFNNTGTVNVNAGTMDFTSLQGTGTLQIGAAGTALLGNSNTTTGTLLHNGTAANSLVLGANTVTVSSDYNNANFGVGNAFNRRANVSATGVGNQILASGDANQAITAGPGTVVNNGATTAPSIVVGNVRVGSTTYTYNIANSGATGPSLRGAIQDAANGGNITDARLSGNGVLSSNWGPVGPGGSTARDITITINTAGVYAPIAGQAVSIINNFENTRSQLLAISSSAGAAAYNPAAAAAITPDPIVVANQRISGTNTSALTIANTAPAGAFTEGLNAAFGTLTGDANTNGGAINLLAGGSSNNTAMRGGVNTATAGAKTGSITVNFASDGTGTSGLPLLALASQTVNVSGNVFQVAQPTPVAPNPVTIANQRVGGTLSQLLTIANTSNAPNGFQEGLDASMGATTGAAVTTGSSAIVNLGQGATNSSSLRVGVDTSTAGAKTGTAAVNLATNGTISGLASLALPGQTVTVNGNVYQVAQPVVPTTVNLGNVHTGGSLSQAIVIGNTLNAPVGFQEGLNVALGSTSGGATSAGSITNLAAGGTSNVISVGLAGIAAGNQSGSVALNLETNGAGTSGLGTLGIGTANVTVNAVGYNLAQGGVTPSPVVIANQRVGGSLTQALTVANNAPTSAFTETLSASFGANGGNATNNGGSIGGIAGGSSNNAALAVGVNTSQAGARSGTVTVNLASNEVNGSGLGTTALAPQAINVSGNVYQMAQGQINTAPLNFGTVQVGQSVSQALSISNIATGAAGFVEDLNINFGASSGQGASQIFGTGSIVGLLAGSTNGSNMTVSVNTATAGTINGSILVNFFTAGAVNSVSNGLGVTAVGSSGYGVQGVIQSGGQVVDQANPVINTPTVALGNVRVGDAVASQFVSVTNQASGNPQAALNASISTASGPPLTATGSFNLLAPGATNANSLQVSMGNTSAAGSRSGTATVAFVSDASNIGNCAPNCQLNLPSQAVNITGGVYQVAQPVVPTTVNLGNVHTGGSLSQAIVIGNTLNAPVGFQEGLNVALGSTSGGATSAGSITNLAAGGTSNVISVGLAGIAAGNQSGSVALNLETNGAGTSGLGTLGIGTANVTVNAVGYNLAQGGVTPSPVVIANQRVGGSLTQALTVANNAPTSAFTETLSASFGANGGNATNNGGSIGGIAGGSSNNAALAVGVNTSQAGARSGTVTVNLASNEVNGSGLGTTALAPQAINVSGNVYQMAQGQINTAPLNFGTVQVGQSVSQALSISNIATGAAGFVEDLNINFGASSGQGASQIFGTGSIVGLLAGSTNGSNMTVSVNTATAGTINGSILVNFFTAGAVNSVSNGLGVTAVGSSGYGVQGVIQSGGQVVDQANPVINTPTVALGNVRVGDAVASQFVSVTNQASGNPQAALNASISTASGPPLTATGSFNLLAPGATNANSLQVSMGNTSAAGSRSGTATVAFVSDASNIGNCAPNCQLNLPSQAVNITGGVYQVAQPAFGGTTVNLAAARIGGTSQQALSITNTNVAPGFQEGLTASISAPTAGIIASGGFTNLAAGGTNGSSLLVSLDTTTAGARNGTATVNLVSTGVGTSGLADLGLGSQSINVSGNVYAPAVSQLNTMSIDFGIVRVGDAVAARNVSVTNAAPVQGLNDTLQASFGTVSSPFSGTGIASGIGAGDSNASGSLLVALSTANAGVFNGTAGIDFASQNPEMSDLALGTQLVALTGQVNNLANPIFGLVSGAGNLTSSGDQYLLDLGILTVGTEIDDLLRLTNSVAGPADDLRGQFSLASADDFAYTGWLAFTGLSAGSSVLGLGISFDALTAGLFEDVVSLSSFSYNSSDPNGILQGRSLTIRATVIDGGSSVPEPDSLALLVLAGLIMMLMRVRHLSVLRRRGGEC